MHSHYVQNSQTSLTGYLHVMEAGLKHPSGTVVRYLTSVIRKHLRNPVLHSKVKEASRIKFNMHAIALKGTAMH